MEQQKAKTAKKSDNRFLKGAIIGGAAGLVAGGVGGYFAARKKLLKKCKADVKKAYEKGYSKGEEDTFKDAQEVIDEIKGQCVIVDRDANAEDIRKAIDEKIEKENNKPAAEVIEEKDPIKAGEKLNEAYEEAIGAPLSPKDIDNWDLSIDDEDAMKRSEERERYLDLVDKYKKYPEDGPMHISRKQFEEEAYLDKDWVTYYAGDNVFSSDHDADHKMDAFKNFGVVNGNDLFETHIIDDDENDDPNIVYIRNFAMNTVYEVTRTQESHARLESGEVFLKDGESDQAPGNAG